MAIGRITEKNDRLQVTSNGFVLLVADSSFDGIIVDCVASAILSADAFSFVLFAICRKGGLFFLLSLHTDGTEV